MIVGALLARNEAGPDRYLKRCVENAKSFCDTVVAVDDGSTDGTVEALERLDVNTVVLTGAEGYWGADETTRRRLLWDLTAEAAGADGWVYVFDADHELVGIDRNDLATLCKSSTCNAWAFPLYDCWDGDRQMRTDGFWQAHLHPRPWLVKALPHKDFKPLWEARRIHCGHIPHNYPLNVGVAPGLAGICHLGYVQPEHRVAKHKRYTAITTLTDFERAHAESILDHNPHLEPIPLTTSNKILVGTVIRKPPEVIEALLRSIRWQRLREKAVVDVAAITNFAPSDPFTEASKTLLHKALDAKMISSLDMAPAPEGDYGEGASTRTWTPSAYNRIAALKDALLKRSVAGDYTHCWLLDADVICDPHTLQCLLDNDAPVVSAVYWTQWQYPEEGSATFVHAGPQVWQRGSYDMSGWLSGEKFREKLINRARLQIGGLGACTLLRKDTVEKGLSFAFFREHPMGAGGMAEGEDRHFCARAAALHVPLFADAWSDIYHAYHPRDYHLLPEMLQALETWPHPDGPTHGDLVNFAVEQVEPVRNAEGRMRPISRQFVRGRFGSLPVLPQIEEALSGLKRGESRLIRVHFPVHYYTEALRGQTRIMRITLLDCKAFRFAPTIEAELFQGNASQRALDMIELTPEQVSDMEATNG